MIVMIHGCASPILYFYCAYVCNFTFFSSSFSDKDNERGRVLRSNKD